MSRMRWGRNPITLQTTGGPRQVPASTYGAWAVHDPIQDSNAILFSYAVTHVPTGLLVGYGFPKPQARRLCQQLHKIVGDRPLSAGLKDLPPYVVDQMRVAIQVAREPMETTP